MDLVSNLGEQPDPQAGEQAALFSVQQLGNPRGGQGFRGPAVCQIVGITYRQLDYWARSGLVEPSLRAAAGSGSQRLYGFADLVVLKVVKRLLTAGVSLQNIRVAANHLRARGVQDLAQTTLISDGVSIYECHSPEEITDLLHGGQGVFGIALSSAMREVLGVIEQFPTVMPAKSDPVPASATVESATVIGLPARRGRAAS